MLAILSSVRGLSCPDEVQVLNGIDSFGKSGQCGKSGKSAFSFLENPENPHFHRAPKMHKNKGK